MHSSQDGGTQMLSSPTAIGKETLYHVSVPLFTAIFSSLSLAAYYVWKHRQASVEYDQAEKTVAERRAAIQNTLAEILVEAYQQLNAESTDGKTRPDGGMIIDELNEEIDQLIDELDTVHEPRKFHREYLRYYRKSYARLAMAALATLAVPVVIVAVSALARNPFTWSLNVFYAVVGIYGARCLYRGIKHFQHAQELQDKYERTK